MLTGKILRFDEARGFGFIAPDNGGEDVFVHANVLGDNKHLFTAGTPVEFEVTEGERGLKARMVRLAGAAAVSTRAPKRADEDEEADGMCDVLPVTGFLREITEACLDAAPSLTGAQIVQLRSRLVTIAQRHGWVEG